MVVTRWVYFGGFKRLTAETGTFVDERGLFDSDRWEIESGRVSQSKYRFFLDIEKSSAGRLFWESIWLLVGCDPVGDLAHAQQIHYGPEADS